MGTKTRAQRLSPREVLRQQKTREVVQLRVDGWDFNSIADELKITSATAKRYLEEYFTAKPPEDVERLRQLHLMRLDAMLSAFMPDAVNKDFAAAEMVLAILSRQARMYGIDAPLRVKGEIEAEIHHSGQVDVGGEVTIRFVDAKTGLEIDGFATKPPALVNGANGSNGSHG